MNRLREAIVEAGYVGFGSLARFARDAEIDQSVLSALMGGQSPVGAQGSFSTCARKIMEALGAAPGDIWDESEFLIDWHRKPDAAIDDGELEDLDREKLLNIVRLNMDGRRYKILCLLFGIGTDVHNRSEVAEIYGLTQARIQQIEHSAIFKLRKTPVIKQLVQFF